MTTATRTLTRVYAPAGTCPYALPGPSPDTVRTWAEECREHYQEHGQYLTVTALCSFARHALPQAEADELVRLIREEFADEYQGERELTRQQVRGVFVKPAQTAKEYAGPRLADTVKAATGGDVPVQPTSGRGATILGVPATGVVRWMGKAGWDADRACRVVAAFGVDLAVSTVRTQLGAGAKGERGGPAALTTEQIALLESK